MMDSSNDRRYAFEVLPWTPSASQGEFGRDNVIGPPGSGVSNVADRVADVVRGVGIIDLTARGDHSLRKGPRDLRKIRAVVLHQMACCFRRRDKLTGYLR